MLTQEIFDDEIGSCMKLRQVSSMLMTLVVWKTIENRVTSSKHLSFSSRTSKKRGFLLVAEPQRISLFQICYASK